MENDQNSDKITVREIVFSGEEEKSFCDVFIYEPENIEEHQLGNLYIIGEVLNLPENSSYLINLLASIIKREFYLKTKRTTMESLEAGLQKANSTLYEMAEQGNMDWIGNLNMACGAYKDREFYFSQVGKIKTLLVRENRLTDIGKNAVKEESAYPAKTFANIVSGDLETNDLVLFATPEILNIFSLEKIKQLASSSETDKLALTLQNSIEKEKGISTAGVLLVKIEKEFEEKNRLEHLEIKIDAQHEYGAHEKVDFPPIAIMEKEAPPENKKSETVKAAREEVFGESAGEKISLEDIIKKYEKERAGFEENMQKKEPEETVSIAGKAMDREEVLGKTIETDQNNSPDIPADEKKAESPIAKRMNEKIVFFKDYLKNLLDKIKILKNKIAEKSASFFKKTAEKSKNIFHQKQQTSEEGSKKKLDFIPGRKKIILTAAVTLILILAGNLIYTDYKNKQEEKNRFYNNILSQAKDKAAKAEEVLIYKDTAQARTLLAEAKKMALETKSNYKNLDKNAGDLLDKIQKQIDTVDFINRIDNPEIAADLAKEGAKSANQIIKTDNKYYIIDSESNLYQLDLTNKNASKIQVSSNGKENLILSTAISKTGEIVFLTDSNKIEIFDPIKKELAARIIDFSDANPDIKDIAVYNSSFYTLDSSSGQIYKYQMAANSFGKGKSWLASEAKMAGGVSLAIDGQIYMLNADGTVDKYLAGNKKNFALEKLSDPISGSGRIYAEAELKFLYITDPLNKRILQFDKNKGNIVNQYASESFGDIKGIAIDNKEEKIYILNDAKVFVISIKK